MRAKTIAYLKALGVEVYEVPHYTSIEYIEFRCVGKLDDIVQVLDDKSCMDDGEVSDLPLGAGSVTEENDVIVYTYWDRGVETLTREIKVTHSRDYEVTLIGLRNHAKCQDWSNS